MSVPDGPLSHLASASSPPTQPRSPRQLPQQLQLSSSPQASSGSSRRTAQSRTSRPATPSGANTLADLTANVRRTTGQVPPGLVGFSSTVIGDKIYVFGGRLVNVRRMVSELRALDLNTLVWEKLWPLDEESEKHGPQPRYFHSADAWGSKLVIFGGMGQDLEQDPQSPRQGQEAVESNAGPDPNLSVLSDILIFDTETRKWDVPVTTVREDIEAPLPRYAHLSAITNGCLIILGGQDILNRYIEQLCCLELETMTYVQNSAWQGHAGTYRSIAVSRQISTNAGGPRYKRGNKDSISERTRAMSISTTTDSDHTAGTPLLDDSLQLPYSEIATAEEPVYTFTNYNFADVQRALDMISAPSSPDWKSSVTPLSDLMVAAPSLPPGLRFPTAATIGTHLVLTGTLITQQVSSFAIWTLDLSKVMTPQDAMERPKLTWQKVDAGHALKSGSWNRAVAWRNNVIVLGDRDRDIAIDYNRRQNNFTHVAFVDLETIGIYQPPPLVLPFPTQEFGLNILNQPLLADFDVICTDGVRLPCSRGVLEERWPWFKAKLDAFTATANETIREAYNTFSERENGIHPNGMVANADPDATIVNNSSEMGINGEEKDKERGYDGKELLTVWPCQLNLPENSQVGAAILEYFYSLNLITPLQYSLHVLVSLLLFAKNYEITHLRALAAHALHCRLTSGQVSPAIVYEAAALGGCLALQTRALRMMMNANAKLKLRSPSSVSEVQKRK